MNDPQFTLHELLDDPSFNRWATGHANDEETRQWDEWIESSDAHRNLAQKAQKKITGIAFDDAFPGHRDEDWNRVKEQISIRQKAFHFDRLQKKKRNTLSLILKAAAILLILSVSGLVALQVYQVPDVDSEQQVLIYTIKTDYSEKKSIVLSDGSEIILAAGSSISHKDDWLHQPVKQITLVSGEAFFSIMPSETRTQPTFEVITEDGITTVLGTKFTVSTFGEGTRVVLQEGEVQVSAAHPESENHFPVKLAPGDMAEWSRQHDEISLQKVNPLVYTSWISEQLFFDDTPLSHLVNRIKHTYGMEVQVKDPSLLDDKISGSVDFRSLDGLIYAVAEVLDIDIKRVDSQIIIE